ncbi:uncharacterized protein TNCT_663871 [Trichonephila clavata]|uniref:Uncharacterized protein n=1 Tax=Trichonephila clavata TaxID=2740835 RepID=A0A8X6KK83_TRICU|nr:uncharacterized protein TNCT_663871 [Trichonephila clavata]
MKVNNQIPVLTQNNWNTWKHDMQVIIMHYGCWKFIIQTKPEEPDERATYKEKCDFQLRKDRCYTMIYTNISSDLKNLITETTDGVVAWKILKDHFEPVTQLLEEFFGTRYQPGEDVGIFISRVKTAATRLQEAGHKLDDLYIGFQLIRWLRQEFQSTVQQIYKWKEDFTAVKIKAELILEANRLQLMKQDLEKTETVYFSNFLSKKKLSKVPTNVNTVPGGTTATPAHPSGKTEYQKKEGSTANETYNTEFNINLRFCEAENKLVETINVRFDEYRKGIGFKPKTNGYPRLDVNFPDYDDEEDDFDTTKPEEPDEGATYKEKCDFQLRKDRCYTVIYTNISSDLKNLITETTDGVVAWKILKDHFEPVTQLLDNSSEQNTNQGKMSESSYLV